MTHRQAAYWRHKLIRRAGDHYIVDIRYTDEEREYYLVAYDFESDKHYCMFTKEQVAIWNATPLPAGGVEEVPINTQVR